LTVFDALISGLTFREYRKQLAQQIITSQQREVDQFAAWQRSWA